MENKELSSSIQKGPCIACGDINYPLSFGGPKICPSCDCGIPPEVTKLRKELFSKGMELIEAQKKIKALREAGEGLKKAIKFLNPSSGVYPILLKSEIGQVEKALAKWEDVNK